MTIDVNTFLTAAFALDDLRGAKVGLGIGMHCCRAYDPETALEVVQGDLPVYVVVSTLDGRPRLRKDGEVTRDLDVPTGEHGLLHDRRRDHLAVEHDRDLTRRTGRLAIEALRRERIPDVLAKRTAAQSDGDHPTPRRDVRTCVVVEDLTAGACGSDEEHRVAITLQHRIRGRIIGIIRDRDLRGGRFRDIAGNGRRRRVGNRRQIGRAHV